MSVSHSPALQRLQSGQSARYLILGIELIKQTGGLEGLTTEDNITRDSLDSSSNAHHPQLQLEMSSDNKL